MSRYFWALDLGFNNKGFSVTFFEKISFKISFGESIKKTMFWSESIWMESAFFPGSVLFELVFGCCRHAKSDAIIIAHSRYNLAVIDEMGLFIAT